MSSQPLVSVIVPVYNVADYLPRCVDSLLRQTYPRIEIILVDDGSTDRSSLLCDQYAKQHPHVQVIHQKNAGLPAARNTGLANMHGEFFTFVDADDWVDPKSYELLVAQTIKNNTDFTSCDFCFVSEKRRIERSFDLKKAPGHLLPDQLLFGLLKTYNFSVANKLFRSSWVGDTRFDPAYTIAEDLCFLFKLIKKGATVAHVNKPLYFYCQRQDSIMHTGSSHGWCLAMQMAISVYNEFEYTILPGLQALLLDHVLTRASIFALMALLDGQESYERVLQARQILQKHRSFVFTQTNMGWIGKIFVAFLCLCPQLTARICRVPFINQQFLKIFTSRVLA